MSVVSRTDKTSEPTVRLAYDLIPVRNVWFLFLYAHDLARFQGRFDAEVEDSPDFKCLIARLLCHVVEIRLKRNLSFGYCRRAETLKRVRGRIDLLTTMSRGLFRRGEVACRFDELTIDTTRNRFLRAALDALGKSIDDQALAHRSRTLANVLGRAGVDGVKPSREQMASEQFGRHEADDRLIVSLARAVFELVLPTETAGPRAVPGAQRRDTEFRRLFERAVGNFFAVELSREEGWWVSLSNKIKWPVGAASRGIGKYLPEMETDIMLENEHSDRRIVIDTKFTNILTKARFADDERFKSKHIFQLYSYLRSQERDSHPRSLNSEGVLLYPAIGFNVDDAVELQGHIVRFVTVDLAEPTNTVLKRLRQLPFVSRLG